MPQIPYLVGVAGPSCAGKGTLCRWLSGRFAAATLPVDAYYRPLDHLSVEERAGVNFDDPASMDHLLLAAHLEALGRGETVAHPVYDFALHTREPGWVDLAPEPLVFVEGLFPLYWPEIRKQLSASIFITAGNTVCLDRRLRRDTVERGRSAESVQSQYLATVEPMRSLYVDPTAAYAGLVLDGRLPIAENGAIAARYLEQTLGVGGKL